MSTTTTFKNCNFGGIRRKNSSFSEEKITCSDCQNVELYYTELNSGVGIRTTKGNLDIGVEIASGEEVIALFETTQLGTKYLIVYTESATNGQLYYLNQLTNELVSLVTGLTKTGKASATDFQQGWLDMFIFSNGTDVKYIYSNSETSTMWNIESDENIHLIDQDGRTVKGLGLIVFDSRLWIFNDNVLWYSEQSECRNFTYNESSTVTSAGYIEFSKDVTAIYNYLGSLAVFHSDSSCLVTVDETTGFKQGDESPGGCASYNSLVFHGTDLYFYDDTKKGVFSFQQIVNGDKTLGENIALDIQDELISIDNSDVDKIRTLSIVTSDRNEVWFLLPISNNSNKSIVMIFDYARGEWVKRKCQIINSIVIFNNDLYSAGEKIYHEYETNTFNGEFIDNYYTCTIFNLDSDNTLKITKMPPRVTVEGEYDNDFNVKYVKNYNILKEPKTKRIKAKTIGEYLIYDSGMTYDNGINYKTTGMESVVKLPSTTFKALEITFYTSNKEQNFCFKCIELSKLKVKQV